MRNNSLSAPADTESKPAPIRMNWTLDELVETGHGCRAQLYCEIAEGRLIAHKLGRRTMVREEDRAAWVASWPKAQIKADPRRAKAANAAA